MEFEASWGIEESEQEKVDHTMEGGQQRGAGRDVKQAKTE